jgi:murein L,D-transpeptidase YcbB/YkuD
VNAAAAKPAEALNAAPAPASKAKPQASAERANEPILIPITMPAPLNDKSESAPASLAETSEPTEQPTATVPREEPPALATSVEAAPSPMVTETPATAHPLTATGGGELVPTAVSRSPSGDEALTATSANGAAPSAVPISGIGAETVSPVAEQLRELVNGKFDRSIGVKKERGALDVFYGAHNYAPIWITDGKLNERAQAAIAYLSKVDGDGLDPADYPVPRVSSDSDPAALAEAEIQLSTSIVTYAHHASIGRVSWSRVSKAIEYELKAPSPADVLSAIADTKDVAATLAAYEPQVPNYFALKTKLAELRAGKVEGGRTPIANEPAPKIGAEDDRVPQLRERLGLFGDGVIYDKALAAAVRKFQQEHELRATGLLNQQTIGALNGRQPDQLTDTILANLERWRWMPHELGTDYVIVNLPDYTLRVFHDGQQVWMTRIVIGKPNMPTPIMTAEMKFITVNPTWNVPQAIVEQEYMPALAQDPTVLARMGLKVSSNPDGTIHVSQPPGDRNALGRLRFNFPNKFLVYQHDTPDKYLFALGKRAFSHGCMRVQDPAKYAELLLNMVRPGEGYTEERLRKMFGQGERDLQFPRYVPVHLTYQTAFVGDEGELELREDVYGRDKALLSLLKSGERTIVDYPIAQGENAMRHQRGFVGVDGRGNYSVRDNFFSRLFGSFGGTRTVSQSRRRAAGEGHQSSGYYR